MSDLKREEVQKDDKENNTGEKKRKSIFFYIVLFFCIAQIVISCMTGYHLIKLLPTKYMVILATGVVLFNALLLLSAKKKWIGIIMIILSCVISAGMLYGMDIVKTVDKAISNIASNNNEEQHQEVTKMTILVLKDSAIHEISDLKEFIISYVNDDDYEHTKKLMDEINTTIGGSVQYKEFSQTTAMIDALCAKTIDALIINEAHIEMIAELEEYKDLSEKTKAVYSSEIISYIEVVEKQETDLEHFVVYISGIDRFGHIGAKSRSDVNILAIVNTKTHHIQLINTPRDYYIKHSKSKGKEDKLTHAGIYGINASKRALEVLYDIDIDFYVKMNFSGFEGIIDALGGIDVYSEYDFTVEPIKHYTVGMNHLNGIEALAFARERKSFKAGDIQRGKNQMEVIKATVNKMTSSEMLFNYATVMEELSWCFQTDMASDDIYALVREQLADGRGWTFDSYTVTGKGAYKTTYSTPNSEAWVMLPDEKSVEQAKKLIKEALEQE